MTKASFHPDRFEKHIANDPKFAFTLTSYALILMTYINLNAIRSAGLGIAVFILYFSINGVFLAHAFFEKKERFFRLIFGVLLLIMLLGFVSWLVMVIYDLDVPESALVLFIVSTICSLMNKRMKNKNATQWA
jgi:hypothetical protein